MESRGIAQISTNITDTKASGIFEVFSEINRLANEHNLTILESELVGAITLQDILKASKLAFKFTNLNETNVINLK